MQITYSMIKEGLSAGVVKIIDCPNGDGAVCKIGDNWFYFGGQEAEVSTAAEYRQNVPDEEIAREIYEVLQDFEEQPEVFDDEYKYYYYVLLESGIPGYIVDLESAGVSDDFKQGYKAALQEINRPIPVIAQKWSPSLCPRCHKDFDEQCNDGYYIRAIALERCPHCGQKLDWSKADD